MNFKNPTGKLNEPYTEERLHKLEQITLKRVRKILGRSDLTVEEMSEKNKVKRSDKIRVSFFEARFSVCFLIYLCIT